MGSPSDRAKRHLAFAASLALVLLASVTSGCATRSSKGAAGPPACRNDAVDDAEVGEESKEQSAVSQCK